MSFFLILVDSYPVESLPLKNNPDSWNFGAENLSWESASALTSDSHVKKSKITPKSIFIAPSSSGIICPSGYKIDDNGKCLKIITIDSGNVLQSIKIN
jgi:hypothetical protein